MLEGQHPMESSRNASAYREHHLEIHQAEISEQFGCTTRGKVADQARITTPPLPITTENVFVEALLSTRLSSGRTWVDLRDCT